MQIKRDRGHKNTPEVIEYIEKPAKAEPSVTFDEVDEDLMDHLVDRRLHEHS